MNIRTSTCRAMLPIAALLVSAALWPGVAAAQVAPPLGQAEGFAVLGGSAVTNTGATLLEGDVGVSPDTALIGFPPGITSGTLHVADAVAAQAQSDLVIAYDALAGQAADVDLTGQDLGGLVLTAGVYAFADSAQLTGTLILDAQGDPDAVFVFQIGSTLTTASGSSVQVINGDANCNVFWQVGSSATLGTGSSLVGNILALASITMTTGATASGRLLARNGAVTLDTNTVDACTGACAVVSVEPATLPPASVGNAFSQTLTATGGEAPYAFSLVDGVLPTGLALDASGEIAGVPVASGTFNFDVRATDADGCFGEQDYTLLLAVGPGPGPGPIGPGRGAQTIPALPPLGLLLLGGTLLLAGWFGMRR